MKDYKDLTRREKIGQLLVCGFYGYEVNDDLVDLIKNYKVGNFILFARNIKDKEQLATLTRNIHELCLKEIGVMPFICIDQEGGMVTRIMDKETTYPGQMTLGATSTDSAEYVGHLMGEHLLHLGINFNLSPSVDVNNNPDYPVIGVRSYGDNPLNVAKYANGVIKGMQDEGIIACAKHFPGHGDVSVDSHLGLATVKYSKDRLQAVELAPFKSVITNKVKSIMTAHIIFNAYDKTTPATLSKTILSDLLRRKLHFKGLIISDDMEMKAIDDLYTAPVGAAKGIIAGLDLACCCHTKEKQIYAIEKIDQSIDDGLLTMEDIDKKLERIFKVKKTVYKKLDKAFLSAKKKVDVFSDTSSVRKCQGIVDSSLTKVSGQDYMKAERNLVLYTDAVASTIAEDKLNICDLASLIKSKADGFDTLHYDVNTYSDFIVNKSLEYDTVVFISFNAYKNKEQARMINKINSLHSNFFVLSLRNPYDYLIMEGKSNFYTLYEATPLSYNTIIKFLNGKIGYNGISPVNLARHFNIGASLYINYEEYNTKSNNEYMHLLKEKGIEYIFVSALHVLTDPIYLDSLNKLIKSASEIGLNIVMDVNKSILSKGVIPLDVYALRLDYGFKASDVKELIDQGHRICLNGSTLDEDYIKELVNVGIDTKGIMVCHNFYPKPYSGLTEETVLEKNRLFKKYGFRVITFVPSSSQKRGPIFDGLPTVEDQRHLDLRSCLAEMIILGSDDVCFGDAYASSEELDVALSYDRDVVCLPIVVYSGLSQAERRFLTRLHLTREDQGGYIVRTEARAKDAIKPFNTVERNRGDITIDNKDFDRYKGELNIVLKDIPADSRVNVVGRVIATDWMINQIKPGMPIRFEIVKEEKVKK